MAKVFKRPKMIIVIKVIGGEPFVTKDFIDMLHAVIKIIKQKIQN